MDIWSDVACPWCYLGAGRFAAGVEQSGVDVDVEYHSFELAPDTPLDFEGSEVDFLATHKGMPHDQVVEMLGQMTQRGASEGVAFDFEAIHHTRTLAAHQVLHLAKTQGLQAAMAQRLFRAYFEQGRHLGRPQELADLAAEVGLDRDEVLAALADARFADDVAADIAQARAYGINGVPFYVIAGRYGISGAQTPEVFADALRTASTDGVAAGSPTP